MVESNSLAIQLSAIAIVAFIPFTKLWLNVNYYLHKTQRELIVESVYSGKLSSNISCNSRLIDLGSKYPKVSTGRNQILVENNGGLTYVFFYKYRGVFDNYPGFIYVPDGSHPRYFQNLNKDNSTQIIQYDPNWYCAAHS